MIGKKQINHLSSQSGRLDKCQQEETGLVKNVNTVVVQWNLQREIYIPCPSISQ